MIKTNVSEIFSKYGLEVRFAEFEKVKIKETKKNYRTVFLTYIPYFYEPEDGQNLWRYAALEDYHKYVPQKLSEIKNELEKEYPKNIFDIFADNSPINEKHAAEISGLGIRGRNSLIITEKHGSFVFLGEIITDLEVVCEENKPSVCSGCGACEKACPAGALNGGRCDVTKCISALTQKKGELTEAEKASIIKNGMIWGCDRCQEVCPMNKDLKESEYSKNTVKLKTLTAKDLEGLTDKEFRKKYSDRAFTWRGISTLKRNIELIENQKS